MPEIIRQDYYRGLSRVWIMLCRILLLQKQEKIQSNQPVNGTDKARNFILGTFTKATLSNQIKQEINVSESLTPMYLLSNTDKTFGAITIYMMGALALIAEQLKADLYIIPSSIHECIIVPFNKNYNKSSLLEMVKDINETQVTPEEVLSNRVYTYTREKKEVII